MTRSQQPRQSRRNRRNRRTSRNPRHWLSIGAGIAAAVAVLGALVWLASGGDSGSQAASTDTGNPANVSLPQGPIRVADVEVAEPVADLGRVALNTPVRREWRLRNVGATTVTIERPSIEVLEGC